MPVFALREPWFPEQELVLRDNLLKKIPPVGPLVSLTLLDLSYNEISSMEGIGAVTTGLQQLFLASNQISQIQELDKLGSLAMLELGSNKIRVRGFLCCSFTLDWRTVRSLVVNLFSAASDKVHQLVFMQVPSFSFAACCSGDARPGRAHGPPGAVVGEEQDQGGEPVWTHYLETSQHPEQQAHVHERLRGTKDNALPGYLGTGRKWAKAEVLQNFRWRVCAGLGASWSFQFQLFSVLSLVSSPNCQLLCARTSAGVPAPRRALA